MSNPAKSTRSLLGALLQLAGVALILIGLIVSTTSNYHLLQENEELRASIAVYQRILHEHNIPDPTTPPKEPAGEPQ